MRPINFILALLLLSIVFSCNRKTESTEVKINRLLKDADPSLYLFIKSRLPKACEDSLCQLHGNVVFDITISIDSNSIEDVHMNGAYVFDDSGGMASGFSSLSVLERILNETTFEQFPEYKDSTYGAYGLKIEFTRYFCN